MSSNLTSVSINKNKSRFAPKVKARPTTKRIPGNDASTSTASSSSATAKSSLPSTESSDRVAAATTAAKASSDSSIHSGKIDESVRQISSSTIPSVPNSTSLLSVSSTVESTSITTTTTTTTTTTEAAAAATATTTAAAKKSIAKRRPSKVSLSSGTPIVIGAPSKSTSSSAKPTTSISAPTNKTQHSVKSSRTETVGTPSTSVPDASEGDDQSAPDGLTKRQKLMKNIKAAMKKSDKTPISTPIKSAKPSSGNSFAAPSNTTPTSSTSTSTSTTIAATSSSSASSSSTATAVSSPARRRRVKVVQRERPTADDDSDMDFADSVVDEDDELGDESDGEYTDINLNVADARRKRKLAKTRREASKRKKAEVLLAKDMKTLDDLTADPLVPEDLDRNIKYFLKDLPRGVVTKQFRDEQIEREQAQLQRAEEAAALKNDQDALGRLAEQRQALQLQKEKDEEAERVKKAQEEKEQRKKQQQQQQASGLSESNHALQVRMVNGQIVLDTDSMMIDQNKDREEISHEHMEVVEENAQSRKVNSKTYGKNTGNKRWTAEETELFYKLLSQFGTDFEMMAQMIPNRSRIQVRLKYNKEQRVNPEKVTEYLIQKKEPLDLETFKQVTGLEFEKVPDHFHSLQLA